MAIPAHLRANPNELIAHLPILIDNLIEEAQDNLQAALGDFQELIAAVLEADPADFAAVNDSLLALLEIAVEQGADLAGFAGEVFASWAAHLADSAEAAEDLLQRLYDRFVADSGLFRMLLQSLIATLSDFPGLFRRLAMRAAADPGHYRDRLEAVLLPLFFAGLLVGGPENGVKALRLVLSDTAPTLRQRVTWFELGLPAAGLADWQVQLLKAPAFTLPAAVWMMAALLEALRQASDFSHLLPDGISVPNPALQSVLGPVVGFLGQLVSDYLNNIENLVEALIANLLQAAENDFEIEWLILQLARFTPVGLLFILVGTATKLLTSPAPWLSLLLNPIEDNPDLQVRRLPPPSETVKYIIFSDIHRDARADERPPYQFGSIDHFMPNRELYYELLKHYADQGYVIIEAGDCEELWFHRDFSVTPDQKLAQIIETHSAIYELQRMLHAEGRYLRVYGNHDSYLRDPATFAVLNEAMTTPGAAPFTIYDFVIIEGVKTMHDVPFFLGLDSEPNSQRRPLIVTHGHQWDFWNCDANNMLGKLIVSAVVTPLDMLDDPLRDLAGIASQGSPALNFKQILGDLPVFNSWQSYEPAVDRLDAVQHMEDETRRFTDDVQYSETLASLMGLLIPVAPGPADSCGLPLPGGYCLFNLMSIGHTHNPHNEPYYDLKVLPYVKEVLTGLQNAIAEASGGLLNPELGLVKSHYLNSGVSGWYEDCIWAIDLGNESHGTGQPKLVNWTRNTRIERPNHMDWELPHLARNGTPPPGDQLDAYLRGLLAALGELAGEGAARARQVIVQASSGYVAAQALKAWKPIELQLSFGKEASRDGIAQLLFQCLLGLQAGQRGSFRARIELPGSLAKSLHRLMLRHLPGGRKADRQRLAMAIATLAVLDEIGQSGLRRTPGGMPDRDGSRTCLGLLALLAQLQEQRAGRLGATLALEGDQVVAELLFAGEDQSPPGGKPKATALPARPLPTPPTTKQRRGLLVKAYVEQIGTPLRGWTVAVEQQFGRRRETLARAQTNREGEAQLLRLRASEEGLLAPGHRLAGGELWLALYSPAGKEAMRRRLDPRSAVSRISLPVAFPILRRVGFFEGRKGRTVDEKMNELCASWHKRLGDKRDRFVLDDLCLNDLMLAAMAGLADPETPLQREAAKTLQGMTKNKTAIGAVAAYAGKARERLRQCLGDNYRVCDGSGSLRELGERLLKQNGRFAGLKSIFSNPVPDPTQALGEAKAGLGLPSSHIDWNKDCVAHFENGTMDPATATAMAEYYPDGRVLARPSINLVEIWDGNLGGGQIVRRTEVHDKLLNLRLLKDQGGNLEFVDEALAMDVELDSSQCLVLEADAGGRQVVATDVHPGQKITLYGSGFVDAKGTLQVDYRAWEADTSFGRLVPDQNILPAAGLSNLEVEVHGQLLPIDEQATPHSYNGDKIVFSWPESAAGEGIYRLRVSFINNSAYPSAIVQNEDCSLTVERGAVQTQELYFVVLPPVNAPALRVLGRDVECENLTDPESFLGITWPDEVLFNAAAMRQRIVIPGDGGEPRVELMATTMRQDDTLFWEPGTWTPALRLFPENQSFGQLAALEFLLVDFELLEVEGDLDRFVIQFLYAAALVVLALIVAAVVTALVVAVVAGLVAVGLISLGTAETIAVPIALAFLGAALGFIFGAAFAAFLGLQGALNAVVDGADRILSGQSQLDGSRLMLRLSPVRFHRILYPLSFPDIDAAQSLATIEETFENAALGGSYTLRMLIETE